MKPTTRRPKLAPHVLVAVAAAFLGASAHSATLDSYNVAWDSPSTNSRQSMPIGNGEVGLNVWVEADGDLLFYISRTDTWGETGELLKVGRVRVKLSPNPFQSGMPFSQMLKLRQGEIVIRAGEANSVVELRIWVDANRPIIHVEASGSQPFKVQAGVERWRVGDNVISLPDGRTIWLHRNETSNFRSRLKAHNLEGLEATYPDPLLHRTFGGLMRAEGMRVKQDAPGVLVSPLARKSFNLEIHTLTAQTPTVEQWKGEIEKNVIEYGSVGLEESRRQRRAWWNEFWLRSWIRVSPRRGDETEGPTPAPAATDEFFLSQAYTLQRFITASSGRGAYPIKFNGSIFSVDYPDRDRGNPDFRAWGPDYWLQNTRLPYWPLLASGDFEMLEPLFRMYIDTLPLQKERTQRYFGHEGAYFPETMSFWGLSRDGDYGTGEDVRQGKPISWHSNSYIKREWQGGIEVLAMMLDSYAHTGDETFLTKELIPYADEVLTFFDLHYKRDENGKIVFHPAQALETWWDCTNPMPEIAGLKLTLAKLLALPGQLTTDARRAKWKKLIDELPPIPTREENGERLLSPAAKFATKRNSENPELYAVFPYRIYGVGKPDIELARRALDKRLHRLN